jgi:hypothetical protein
MRTGEKKSQIRDVPDGKFVVLFRGDMKSPGREQLSYTGGIVGVLRVAGG